MQPNYPAMVNDFIKPVVSLFLFFFLMLGWVTAFRLMKEVTVLRMKLGKEDEQVRESFKIWILRKSAPIVLPLYSSKTYLQEKQFLPLLKHVAKNRSKILKSAFRFAMVSSIVSTVFGIDSSRTD